MVNGSTDDRRVFTAERDGGGAFYELALELGPRSDDRLIAAARALWRHDHLDGPYADPETEPWLQERVPVFALLSDQWVSHLYGVAKLSDGNEAFSGSVALRRGDPGIDWLVFYIPMPVLESLYGFETVQEWEWPGWKQLDDWFAEIGRTIYDAVPFALGLVGEEVGGATSAAKVRAQEERHSFSMLLPNQRGGVDWLSLHDPAPPDP